MWIVRIENEVFQGPFETIAEASKVGHDLHKKWGFQWDLEYILKPDVNLGDFANEHGFSIAWLRLITLLKNKAKIIKLWL